MNWCPNRCISTEKRPLWSATPYCGTCCARLRSCALVKAGPAVQPWQRAPKMVCDVVLAVAICRAYGCFLGRLVTACHGTTMVGNRQAGYQDYSFNFILTVPCEAFGLWHPPVGFSRLASNQAARLCLHSIPLFRFATFCWSSTNP